MGFPGFATSAQWVAVVMTVAAVPPGNSLDTQGPNYAGVIGPADISATG